MKLAPAPLRSMQRTEGSAAAASSVLERSCIISSFKALRLCGRLSVISKTAPGDLVKTVFIGDREQVTGYREESPATPGAGCACSRKTGRPKKLRFGLD